MPLQHSAVLKVLRNPRYAGAFCFGRTHTVKHADGSLHVETLPQEQWQFLIREVHPGYITWEEYEANLAQLRANRQAHGEDRRNGPAREGPALLQGLVICGRCGNRMTVGYHQQRTQAGNRLHGVLHRHNLVLPPGKPFAAHQQDWWLSLDLPPSEKLRVQQDMSLHHMLEELIKGVEAELGRLSTRDPWVKQLPFLVQLPGLGVLSAMRVLAEISEITRFPSAKHLVGYAGLGSVQK
jgi:Transposase IS116/IS110/IS902 family/Recombinase